MSEQLPGDDARLAFSCYVFDTHDRLLVTRRARSNPTWPGAWTNACYGYPAPGETLGNAVRRHLATELGLRARELVLVLPDFTHRVQLGGVEEDELCPVYLARVEGEPTPAPQEVAEARWTTFSAFSRRSDLSPWTRCEVQGLAPAVTAFLSSRPLYR